MSISKAAPLALCFALAGCPNTDTAVFVEPTLSNEEATVAGGALGVSVTGSFTLELHLGARASDSSDVGLGEFELVTASDKTPIDPKPLPVTADKTLPVDVAQDSTVTLHITFDTGADPLPAATKSALCAASGIAIKGTITDSLMSSATPVFSTTFHPSGC